MIDGILKSESKADKYSALDSSEPAGFRWRILMRSPAWRPPTDVFETEDSLFVRIEVAGMREEDFVIELNGRELLVRGSRQDPAARRAFHQMEIRFGEFAFGIELPFQIDPKEVQAVYKDGFLLISLLKARPRQILISE